MTGSLPASGDGHLVADADDAAALADGGLSAAHGR